MKIITSTIYPAFALFALACFALSPLTHAQCPQICDSSDNTAVGNSALINNTGVDNTAIGFNALEFNTGGHDNTAVGGAALQSNTTGIQNTATGAGALFHNTTGGANTATGLDALNENTTGSNNTATGEFALEFNTTGNFNTAIGFEALSLGTTGSNNIGIGTQGGSFNIAGSNNIDIGNVGKFSDSATIRIGTKGTHQKTFIAGISGVTIASGVGVIIDTFGHLGTVVSSASFKEAIKPMDKASEAILALKPVTFRYKHKLDPEGIPQFGLVAEEVEKVNPALVARDDKGEVNTVRYEAVNAMLLNEFLKEHRKVQELEAAIAQQQKEIKALAASLKEQTTQIRKARTASLK